jgi:hypothetical protein
MMQTLIRRGQVVGRTIVLESELGLPDGAPVEVEIRFHLPAETVAQRQQALQRLFLDEPTCRRLGTDGGGNHSGSD